MNVRLLCLIFLLSPPIEAYEGQAEGGLIPTALKQSVKHQGLHHRVHLGETVSASIALGQINRIVLPFDRPEIRTLNPSTAEIQGHVLYIAPIDPAKVNLYVTNADDPDAAIALSLSPQEIPPQDMTIALEAEPSREAPRMNPGRVDTASGSLESVDFTRSLLKTLAMGQIPEGYRFRQPESGETIRCHQKHLLIQTRQVFYGRGAQVRVGVLRNNGKSPIQLDEETCLGSTPIETVATYPSGPLLPGHEAEIYVVVLPENQSPSHRRPSLIAKKS